MDPREPIPVLLKRFHIKIPIVDSVPFIGLKWAGVTIGALTAMTYAGLLIWSLLPPTKLAVLSALNLGWSILLIIGIVLKKPILLWPALGSSLIVIAVLVLFVVIEGLIFIILVTVQWKFPGSVNLENFVVAQVEVFDWRYALYDFYLLLCLTVFLMSLWVIVYSVLRSMTGNPEANGMELDIKYKSAPLEYVNVFPKYLKFSLLAADVDKVMVSAQRFTNRTVMSVTDNNFPPVRMYKTLDGAREEFCHHRLREKEKRS